jgi:hypothetical protein
METERAGLRTPLRTRIAVGIVASERGAQARPRIWQARFWNRIGEEQWERLVPVWIGVTLAMPPLVFVLAVLLTSPHR